VDAREFRTTLGCEDLEAMKVPREPRTGLLATSEKCNEYVRRSEKTKKFMRFCTNGLRPTAE
jgi:hypothetical protein